MQKIIIEENEAGQRLDKFLFKYFKEASPGFVYKMLRKKNIVLNGAKSDGKDKLIQGDCVKMFLSDETIAKFRGTVQNHIEPADSINLDIIYEDRNVIIVNKPSGILSQKAQKDDISMNEFIISYLQKTHQIEAEQLRTFKPAVCNRLDRNTSGLIVAGKSLRGLQVMSKMFRDRTMNKYYLAFVSGKVDKKYEIKGYLVKDNQANKVRVSDKAARDGQYIETKYEPLCGNADATLLAVKLITGRSHQIRAHLASVGNPIIGDYKYGNKKINDAYKNRYGLRTQLLHSWKMEFLEMKNDCGELSGKTVTAQLPEIFERIVCDTLKVQIQNLL